ncbi:hypothetical protein HDV05_008120, partial [Chytridiales sp. JEL 0842]
HPPPSLPSPRTMMNGTLANNTIAPQRPQQHRNSWDRFPPEIRTHILDQCDALTQFLNAHGAFAPDTMQKATGAARKKLHNELWTAALKMEWEGDLKSLPGQFKPTRRSDWYRLVKTKPMFVRLMKVLHDNNTDGHLPFLRILDNIAMRHCWHDFLSRNLEIHHHNPHQIALAGHMNYLLYLEANGLRIVPTHWVLVMQVIATEGLLEDVQHLARIKPDCLEVQTTACAAESGNLDLVKYLIAKVGCDTSAMDNAASAGHLEIVEYLQKFHGDVGCSRVAMNHAAAHGHLHILRFLHENRPEGCDVDAMNDAAANGHFQVVRYLHENRTEGCTTYAMDWAARNGHIHIVKFLHEKREEGGTVKAMDWAAQNGHLEIVRFLHEHRHEGCTTNAIDYAAKFGHLEIVRFLIEKRQEGCTAQGVDWAIESNHIEVVKYLYTNTEMRCSGRVAERVLGSAESSEELVDFLRRYHHP